MRRSILIVDDSETIRRIIRQFMEDAGLRVYEAVDGIDGLNKVQEFGPDVIILDVMMPRLDGLSAAVAIRKISEAPIILFTFYADAIRPEDVMSSGISAVISKVTDLSVLKERVDLLLGD